MSIQALNWVMGLDSLDNSGAKFVLMVLSNYANEDGECYPSWDTIATKTGTSRQSVYRHLEWLEKKGFIKKSTRRQKGRQSSNLYELQFDFQGNNLDEIQGNNLDKNDPSRVTIWTLQGNNLDISQGNNLIPKPKEAKDEPKERHKEGETENRVCVPVDEKPIEPAANEIEPLSEPSRQSFGSFRDDVEDWWCGMHGVLTLPPDHSTADNLTWLFENRFTVPEMQKFYEFAKTDPEQKSWRKGNITLGAIVKGIALWRATNTAKQVENKPSMIEKCELCDERGLVEIVVDGKRRMTKCKHL